MIKIAIFGAKIIRFFTFVLIERNTMTLKNKQAILCYVDFSSLSENLSHWITLLHQSTNYPIDLLFVIDHNTKNLFGKHYTNTVIEERMAKFRESCGAPQGKNYIREGCNCAMLSQLAEETDAIFCISAVHSTNDVQFLSATAMIKMLRKSRIPCLVIPRKNKFTLPETLCFNIKSDKKQKLIAPWLTFLAKHLHLKTHVFHKAENTKLETSIAYFEKILNSHAINYTLSSEKASSFNHQTNIRCYQMNTNGGFGSKIFGDKDARFIDNATGQAVFCINPQNDIFIPCV